MQALKFHIALYAAQHSGPFKKKTRARSTVYQQVHVLVELCKLCVSFAFGAAIRFGYKSSAAEATPIAISHLLSAHSGKSSGCMCEGEMTAGWHPSNIDTLCRRQSDLDAARTELNYSMIHLVHSCRRGVRHQRSPARCR